PDTELVRIAREVGVPTGLLMLVLLARLWPRNGKADAVPDGWRNLAHDVREVSHDLGSYARGLEQRQRETLEFMERRFRVVEERIDHNHTVALRQLGYASQEAEDRQEAILAELEGIRKPVLDLQKWLSA
ncbi:MAG: hypothetical protein L0191_09970, partial [Acidobacteria bacterium]|nr:hypothetical protein [Acidobacteriota bacterium]